MRHSYHAILVLCPNNSVNVCLNIAVHYHSIAAPSKSTTLIATDPLQDSFSSHLLALPIIGLLYEWEQYEGFLTETP